MLIVFPCRVCRCGVHKTRYAAFAVVLYALAMPLPVGRAPYRRFCNASSPGSAVWRCGVVALCRCIGSCGASAPSARIAGYQPGNCEVTNVFIYYFICK